MGKSMSGDFIGFSFNGVHSSTLGIMRVSNGSRYSDDLLPSYQDKVVDAPGTDETYYFGSFYKQKPISIKFTFDNMTEIQIRQLKQLLSDKKPHELWFDETPYKYYIAKISGSPKINYICFDVEDDFAQSHRIYKGEGDINFIAYYPFARSRYKYLEDYDASYKNKNEWAFSSGLKVKANLDSFFVDKEKENYRHASLWNGGDLETDFKLNISFGEDNYITAGMIQIQDYSLMTNKINRIGDDDGIQIDTRLKLIQGYKLINGKKEPTSNIYNRYITSGDFFKIPLRDSKMTVVGLYNNDKKIEIEYHYWYL